MCYDVQTKGRMIIPWITKTAKPKLQLALYVLIGILPDRNNIGEHFPVSTQCKFFSIMLGTLSWHVKW